MNIRKMNESDFEQVKELQQQIYLEHLDARPDVYIANKDPFEYDYFNSLISTEDNLNFVCEADGKIKGAMLAVIKPETKVPFMKKRKILYIDSIVVSKNAQRQGVGKNLFLFLEDYAKQNNFDAIELNVWNFNKEAIDFYISLGMNIKSMHMEKKYK